MTIRLSQKELNDDSLKRQLQDQLDQAFPNSGSIMEVSCASRTNLIIKVDTATGAFGFKRWTGAQDYDGGEQGCAERDKAMNELAHRYNLPHWSQVVHDIQLNYANYFSEDTPISLTAWLPKQWHSFEQPSDSIAMRVSEAGCLFFQEFGQCLAFGLATGFKDWGPNNFMVMDGLKPRVSLIDMDWSFNCGMKRENDYTRALRHLNVQSLGQRLDEYMLCLTDGFDEMHRRIKENPTTVELAFTAEGAKTHSLRIDETERELALNAITALFT